MHKVKIVFNVLLCVILCTLGLSACVSEKHLSAPENLRIDERTLTWDEVENASGYEVYIDEEVTKTQETSFLLLNLTGPATYTIAVSAIGDGTAYKDSPFSEISFTLEAPVTQGYDERGFKYTLLEDETGYEVHRGKVGFNSEILQGEVYIPDYFNGYPVKRIAEAAFHVFGFDHPLYGFCPSNPISTANCNTVTTSFRLPAYLESIGKIAFYGCVAVEEFVLPESVTQIEANAFRACGSLKRVTLPQGLKEIPSSCFEDCALEEIILPEGLEKIGAGAFRVIVNIDYRISREYKARTKQWFTKIVIPDAVTEIELLTFDGCVKLEDVTLPANLEVILADAFRDCSSLKQIDIPDSVTKIAGGAFERTAIESIVLPAGINKIGMGVFRNTPLKEIFFKGTQEQWEGIEIDIYYNPEIDEATKYFYSETKPTVEGNYWHYVNGEVVVW